MQGSDSATAPDYKIQKAGYDFHSLCFNYHENNIEIVTLSVLIAVIDTPPWNAVNDPSITATGEGTWWAEEGGRRLLRGST